MSFQLRPHSSTMVLIEVLHVRKFSDPSGNQDLRLARGRQVLANVCFIECSYQTADSLEAKTAPDNFFLTALRIWRMLFQVGNSPPCATRSKRISPSRSTSRRPPSTGVKVRPTVPENSDQNSLVIHDACGKYPQPKQYRTSTWGFVVGCDGLCMGNASLA